MQLDSVRSLKRELYEPLVRKAGLRPQQAPEVSVPAGRTEEVALAQPGLALGIAAGKTGNDYRLAVRIQHRDLIGSRRLEAIERAARNEVDLQYIGLLRKHDTHRMRARPLRIGYSVGHKAITAGTIGAFVRTTSDPRPRLLSNNHVLADEDRAAVGEEIIQPGQYDGGDVATDSIAILERFQALTKIEANHVDAALALLHEEVEFCTSIDGLGPPYGFAPAEEVINVSKVGRTTGLTLGAITAIEVDNVVVDFATAQLRFDNQIEIAGDSQSFSMGGDSGSLVVNSADTRAVGLLFAGSEFGGPNNTGVTYANPITEVFERLDIVGFW